MSESEKLTLTELAELAGVTPRTVRYYIQQGILPSPEAAGGPGAHYGEGHLVRLRLVRELQKEHLPLAEVRKRLGTMGDAAIAQHGSAGTAADYVRKLLSPGADTRRLPPPEPPEAAIERSTWERIALTPDLEIHVRRPLSRTDNKMLERLLAHAKALLEESIP